MLYSLTNNGCYYEVTPPVTDTGESDLPNEETTDGAQSYDLQLIHEDLQLIYDDLQFWHSIADFLVVFIGCAVLFYIIVWKPFMRYAL